MSFGDMYPSPYIQPTKHLRKARSTSPRAAPYQDTKTNRPRGRKVTATINKLQRSQDRKTQETISDTSDYNEDNEHVYSKKTDATPIEEPPVKGPTVLQQLLMQRPLNRNDTPSQHETLDTKDKTVHSPHSAATVNYGMVETAGDHGVPHTPTEMPSPIREPHQPTTPTQAKHTSLPNTPRDTSPTPSRLHLYPEEAESY
jgi:hypothetical protein